MSSVNKVILVGNLCKEPELRQMQNGSSVCNITVATNDKWKDKLSGEYKERAEFHRVVIFNEHLAGIAEKYLSKGSKVYVEGALQTRKWTDQSGQDKYTTEVVLGRFKGELTMLGGGDQTGKKSEYQPRDNGGWDAPESSALDDDIPF